MILSPEPNRPILSSILDLFIDKVRLSSFFDIPFCIFQMRYNYEIRSGMFVTSMNPEILSINLATLF